MNYVPTVVFDFDGVIHSYTSGWKGEAVIPDPPVPGISEAIDQLRERGYRVVVVSTRCATIEGMAAVNRYLMENEVSVDEVMAEKPPAICYVDDRAICFRGDACSLVHQIENFKSWVERKSVASTDHLAIKSESAEGYDELLKKYGDILRNQPVGILSGYDPSASMRPCKATAYERGEAKEIAGKFHRWGNSYEEFEAGPANFTTAIIEDDNGKIFACPAETVQFLDRG